jgi:hypothetical protein
VVVGGGATTIAPGGDSYFINPETVLAKGGSSVANDTATGAAGGDAVSGVGDTKYSGGSGATASSTAGGGGGSSAGTAANGNNAASSAGGTAPPGGGNGGNGFSTSSQTGNGSPGSAPGGGGGGGKSYISGTGNGGAGANGQIIISYYGTPPNDKLTTAGNGNWTAPAGVTSIAVECWGGGGSGGSDTSSSSGGAGGGGGGAYAKLNSYGITPGNSYSYSVGAGGNAAAAGGSSFFVDVSTLQAVGGLAGTSADNGAGGAGGAAGPTGDVKFAGGNGANGGSGYGGGGGGSAGTAAVGNYTTSISSQTGAAAVTGGGPGGLGGHDSTGSSPTAGPGGGGGGGEYYLGTQTGGAGHAGQVSITFKGPARVTLSDLILTYTGGPLTPTVTTVPDGLTVAWTGAPQIAAGTCSVTATINDPIYGGSVTGTFSIQKASTATIVNSSGSPSLPTDDITFTATVSASTLVPTGTVQFKSNGSNLGSPIALNVGGQAQITVLGSTLNHGPQAITADYVNSDGNFSASTSPSFTQIINIPPAAGTHYLTTAMNTDLHLSATTLGGLDYDPDGDALMVTNVIGSTSAKGGTISFVSGQVNYSPPSWTYFGDDSFTYTVSDIYGGTALGMAQVTVRPSGPVTSRIVCASATEGDVELRCYGIPGKQYDVQRSPDTYWTNVTVLTTGSPLRAAANGMILFTNRGAPSPSFYRLAVH